MVAGVLGLAKILSDLNNEHLSKVVSIVTLAAAIWHWRRLLDWVLAWPSMVHSAAQRVRRAPVTVFALPVVAIMAIQVFFPRQIDGVFAYPDRTPAGGVSKSQRLTRIEIIDVERDGDRFRITGKLEVAKGPCEWARAVTVGVRGAVETVDMEKDAADGWTVSGPVPPGDLVITAGYLEVTWHDMVVWCSGDVAVIPRAELSRPKHERVPRVPDSGQPPVAESEDVPQTPQPAAPDGDRPTPAPPDPQPARPDPE